MRARWRSDRVSQKGVAGLACKEIHSGRRAVPCYSDGSDLLTQGEPRRRARKAVAPPPQIVLYSTLLLQA
ncbi:hypothetical protein NDU88_006098 [Pleurodeles waltl]|uniref:Uncharacterized protein n=1 Tax=Pleurodeles waltl TaxID=8319 RepID=A0AAV7VPU9_PLEWA|nr:hypothetical protein NDU88_006098 [Pleurodeles waltl]